MTQTDRNDATPSGPDGVASPRPPDRWDADAAPGASESQLRSLVWGGSMRGGTFGRAMTSQGQAELAGLAPAGDTHGLTEADRGALRSMFVGGWRRWLFPGLWLVYLVQTVSGVHKHTDGVLSVVGYAVVALFAITYLTLLPSGWVGRTREFWAVFGVMLGLVVVESFLAHEDAFPMLVYVAVVCVAVFGSWGLPLVGVLTVVSAVVPALIPQWHSGFDWDTLVTLPLVALAMFGFFAIIRANRALTEARAEVARLAAENERTRIARDLHDLLGHSLTTITVKAQLARRLAERDPARATAEIAEVEELTRRSLTQVRAAVAGYRDVTLAGELASAREVLRASGITAELPKAIDEVPPEHEELFGWVLRESVTNIVRHSRATRCAVLVRPDAIEISDDGVGSAKPAGNGLTGLRERVDAAGGRVHTGRGEDGGWIVHVELPAPVPEVTA